jgi:hypothetical protein
MRHAIVLLVLFATASLCQATTALRVSVEQMAKRADIVVRARCVSSEARFTADRSTIETYVSLKTLEVLGGEAPATLTVLCRGGRVGKSALRVTGQPTFKADEEVVLFIRKAPKGILRVLGWCQGKFRIVRDAEAGTVTASQELSGLCFFRPDGDEPRRSLKPDVLPLEDLVKRIKAARTPPPTKDGEASGETEKPADGEVTPPKGDGEKPERAPPAEDR